MPKAGPRLSIRIDLPGGVRFGPGKAALLTAIGELGSLAAAARSLSMSYPRALKLVDDMNAGFPEPLVEKQHGGAGRGGSALTATGRHVLALYRSICDTAGTATAAQRNELVRLIGRPKH